MTYNIIKDAYDRFAYQFFTKPNSINIFGVRNTTSKPNSFDDVIGVAYVDGSGYEHCLVMEATTDPGVTVLGNKYGGHEGTLIMIAGQYYKMFKKGYHKGKYPALQQNIKIDVIRDYDKDNMLDFNSAKTQYGMFGLNLHHANKDWDSTEVNNYSWGCQVIRRYRDWEIFWELIEKSSSIYGDTFSYTLFDDKLFNGELINKLKEEKE